MLLMVLLMQLVLVPGVALAQLALLMPPSPQPPLLLLLVLLMALVVVGLLLLMWREVLVPLLPVLRLMLAL